MCNYIIAPIRTLTWGITSTMTHLPPGQLMLLHNKQLFLHHQQLQQQLQRLQQLQQQLQRLQQLQQQQTNKFTLHNEEEAICIIPSLTNIIGITTNTCQLGKNIIEITQNA